jgi:hypothetical protein
MEKYYPKGEAVFVISDNNVECLYRDYPEYMKDIVADTVCGDIMSGEDFYDCVDGGGIIDYDGALGRVYVNGYFSNLGLHHKGLSQGGFRVDGPTWLSLCDDYDIEVEWCNK